MKMNLGARLFLSSLTIVLVAALVLLAAARLSLPRAYGRHMAGGDGMEMGMPGSRGQRLYENFKASFFEALGWAGAAAVGAALCASLLLSRRLAAPIRAMTAASQRISKGDYAGRVPGAGDDEIGRLAASFNRMAARLEQTEAMRRQLIGDVAHELRTPLTVIRGSLEGLADGVLLPTPETYEQVRAEADRLARLVDDIQELSRVEARAFQLDLVSLPVADLCDAARRRFQRQFDTQGLELVVNLPAGLPLVRADADRVGQVLANLIGNALCYTPAGGRVTLSAERCGREVAISVTDTGAGIPAADLVHIFDRFYRVDKSRSRRDGGGSGVGLTIARALVEAHGGVIEAHSAGAGQGSRFTFTLPFVPDST